MSVEESDQSAGTYGSLICLSVHSLPPEDSILKLSHRKSSPSNFCGPDGGGILITYLGPVLIIIVSVIVVKTFDRIHEGISIPETSVDRRSTPISDRIQVLCLIRHKLSGGVVGGIPCCPVEVLMLHRIHQRLDWLCANMTYRAGSEHPGFDLGRL